MISVHPGLYVGDQSDYEREQGALNWRFVLAAKHPWHRKALGYVTPGAPKEHHEYLWAYRENRLILNMVDADEPRYFAKEMVDEALSYIWDSLEDGYKVLIACNEGLSRAPSLALLYLRVMDPAYADDGVEAGKVRFKAIYPDYSPKNGIAQFVSQHWDEYSPVKA